MRVTFTLLFLLNLIPASYSQDYQTFKSTHIHYYKETATNNMLASEIVSNDFDGLDSILYPFKTLREVPPCKFVDSTSWMGEKIIIEPDGTNLFFNRDGDTITINTQANQGELFEVYKFPSGTILFAKVDTVIEMTFYGITDSVKIYSFVTVELEFDFIGEQFRIGKTIGLIDFFPFYSFPKAYLPVGVYEEEGTSKYTLVGQLYPRLGITKATFNDVNSLNVYDMLSYTHSYGYSNDWTYRKTVIDKTIDGEIATYTFELYTKHYYGGTSSDVDPSVTTYTTEIITESYNISDNFINTHLIPEKNYRPGETDLQMTMKHTEACGFTEKSKTRGSSLWEDGFYKHACHLTSVKFIHSGGLNQNYNYYYFNDGHDYESHNKIFKSSFIDGYICGEGIFLGNSESAITSEVKIFPNPANEFITLSSAKAFNYKIFDLQGKLVQSGLILKGDTHLLVNELQNGMYVIELENGEDHITKKFFKL